jgi:hypothetical protein
MREVEARVHNRYACGRIKMSNCESLPSEDPSLRAGSP